MGTNPEEHGKKDSEQPEPDNSSELFDFELPDYPVPPWPVDFGYKEQSDNPEQDQGGDHDRKEDTPPDDGPEAQQPHPDA